MSEDALPRLGRLERDVIAALWQGGDADVRGVHERVERARHLSPNTIQTTLERLRRKGLVHRRKLGRAFVYEASLTRRQWMARCLDGLAAELPGAGQGSLLAAFVDFAASVGADELESLEALVRARRRSLDRTSG